MTPTGGKANIKPAEPARMNSLFASVQVKHLQRGLRHAEAQMADMCQLLASYARQSAKLRDQADMLVARLFDFSDSEDAEIQVGLRRLAQDFALVQDYRHAQVQRLETQVVAPLKAYGGIIANTKASMKMFRADLRGELKELQKLENIRLNNLAARQTDAEVNSRKASSNAQHSLMKMEESITAFHHQKRKDFKRIFMDFITVEMIFHAKALEVYSHAFQHLLDTKTGMHNQEDPRRRERNVSKNMSKVRETFRLVEEEKRRSGKAKRPGSHHLG
ncbi:CBY1-interacting BAR domain-containing protein 2-like [Nerophis ophidion]|uniref:CBY1-interacting BAR domain-containing protein 2-like n=1 Tax=Nerophis ophidion TaxID=159077 RepID=UPI002AE01E55|nr:CBY1-interacting BAR domain-containing protein 2-like [Nerophis ophidion]